MTDSNILIGNKYFNLTSLRNRLYFADDTPPWGFLTIRVYPIKVSVTVRGVGMFMCLFEKSYKA